MQTFLKVIHCQTKLSLGEGFAGNACILLSQTPALTRTSLTISLSVPISGLNLSCSYFLRPGCTFLVIKGPVVGLSPTVKMNCCDFTRKQVVYIM